MPQGAIPQAIINTANTDTTTKNGTFNDRTTEYAEQYYTKSEFIAMSGEGVTHNNLQPSNAVYRFRRIL